MKNKIIYLSIIASFFIIQTEAQNRTTVNAMNNEISDNLDLRAVASIFGESRNLEDFERRLNDPELQISNLDLNNDNEVDYLRVIETVEYNTHVVIVQSVLDRDVYQDVATIDIERNNNSVQVQFIGNEYMYGPNYIYEPVYHSTPLIYASFWASNYRPYVSNWYWNYYPSYYYAWNPYPIFRYRNNIHLSLNFNNSYNYVNYRRSNLAISLYNTRRTNAYERRYPNYAFTKRYSNYSNRYELDQRRGTRYSNNNSTNRNSTGRQYGNSNSRGETQRDYSTNRNTPSRGNTTPRTTSREYTDNKSNNSRQNTPSRNYNQNNTNNSSSENATQRTTGREYNQNSTNNSRENATQRTTGREYNQNNTNNSRENAPQRTTGREYNQNSTNSSRENAPQRTTSRGYNQNSTNSSRENAPQRTTGREYNQNSTNSSRENAPQRTKNITQQTPTARTYAPRQENSSQSPQRVQNTRENNSSRGEISRPSAPAQRVESTGNNSNRQENNNSSRNNNRRI